MGVSCVTGRESSLKNVLQMTEPHLKILWKSRPVKQKTENSSRSRSRSRNRRRHRRRSVSSSNSTSHSFSSKSLPEHWCSSQYRTASSLRGALVTALDSPHCRLSADPAHCTLAALYHCTHQLHSQQLHTTALANCYTV